MRVATFALAALLAALAGSALAADGPTVRELSVEQSDIAQASPPRSGNLRLSVTADRADATYAVGETVRLSVAASEDAYVTVLDVGPDGKVTQLFPNRFQTDNRVVANRPVEIAPPSSGARVVAAGPTGTELIKVIASSKPIVLITEGRLQGQGAFRVVAGGAKALTRDLQLFADQAAEADARIDYANFSLRTTGRRLGAATLPVTAPPATLVVLPTQQPFPLLIAADKPSYRVGEKIVLAVTTLQACRLTVVEVTPLGAARVIFPNEATPDNAVAAMQTVLISGGASPVSIVAAAPTGVEQVIAFCGPDAAPRAASDRAALTRDLAVVAARPGANEATAGVSFAVVP